MKQLAEGVVIHDRYRCVRRLGSGGMADVWLCEDSQLGREVALKVMHENWTRDPEFIERFRREASSAAGLQHPNVVSIFDRGEVEGTYYIAMEYVEGPTLKELISSGLSIEDSIEIAAQILAGVRFAHQRGIVHRDLKPGNVLVDRSGRARIADFGIAQAGVSEITQTGSVMGTAEYLAPEQAQGRAVTAQSDLYSVGVILYEMLTGRVPFDGETAVAVAMKHVTERPLAPSGRNAKVSRALDQVTLQALAKEPANRFDDAEGFAAALQAARTGAVSADTAAYAPVVTADRYDPATGEQLAAREVYPARPRWPWVAAALAVAVGVIIAIALLTSTKEISVPAVSDGKTKQERAIQILREAGFEVEVSDVERAEPRGTVVDQSPLAGEKADEGSTVTIFVSQGPGEETVPPVAGKSKREATEILRELDFKVTASERFSSTVDPGDVITTSPPAWTDAARGSTVKLLVSKGPATSTVPDVIGKDRAEAITALRDARFIVNTETADSDEPAEVVVDQAPPAGTERPRRSKVTITVSNGRGTKTVPGVIGLRERRGTDTLRKAGFTVTVENQGVDNPAEDGIINTQTPGPESQARDGSNVTIVVGKFVEPPPDESDPAAP